MPYVSARYASPSPEGVPDPKPGMERIIATDHEGQEWSLYEDSQVADWLRFKESENFSILAADAPPEDEPEPAATKSRKRK